MSPTRDAAAAPGYQTAMREIRATGGEPVPIAIWYPQTDGKLAPGRFPRHVRNLIIDGRV